MAKSGLAKEQERLARDKQERLTKEEQEILGTEEHFDSDSTHLTLCNATDGLLDDL